MLPKQLVTADFQPSTPKSSVRLLTGKIWKHGTQDPEDKEVWMCLYCQQKYQRTKDYIIKKHIESHQVDVDDIDNISGPSLTPTSRTPAVTPSPGRHFSQLLGHGTTTNTYRHDERPLSPFALFPVSLSQEQTTPTRGPTTSIFQTTPRVVTRSRLPRMTISSAAKAIPVQKDVLKAKAARWIVLTRQPLRAMTHASFLGLIEYIHPAAAQLLPKSQDTIRKAIMDWYGESKTIVAHHLNQSKSKIHLSFDLWTSSQCRAFIGIVASWTTCHDFVAKEAFLGFREVDVSHTGENIASLVLTVVKEYNIGRKLGTFTLDNASNNDTAIEKLVETANREFDISLNIDEVRLRCLAHILHIVMKTLLLASKAATEPEIVGDFGEDIVEDEDEVVWLGHNPIASQKSPIPTLKFVIDFIFASPSRKLQYVRLASEDLETSPLLIPRANDTRWSSLWGMLTAALPRRNIIDAYIAQEPKLREFVLSEGDWRDLSTFHQLMRPVERLSRKVQAHVRSAPIALVIPALDALLEEMKLFHSRVHPSSFMFNCIKRSLTKFEAYRTKLEKSSVYFLAVVLDPRRKLDYFCQNKTHDEVLRCQRYFFNSCRRYLPPSSTPKLPITSFKLQQEFDRYLKSLKLPDDNNEFGLLEYWKEREQDMPLLAHVACEIYSIPASSAETERMFSAYSPSVYFGLLILSVQSSTLQTCVIGLSAT